MMFESVLPAFFWYGIHSVEMLYRILGRGCVSVAVTSSEHYDCIVGTWRDGRIVVRGNRKGNYQFGALIHRANSVSFVRASRILKQRKHWKLSVFWNVPMKVAKAGRSYIYLRENRESTELLHEYG